MKGPTEADYLDAANRLEDWRGDPETELKLRRLAWVFRQRAKAPTLH